MSLGTYLEILAKYRRNHGFTLLMVLFLSIVALAFVGITLQIASLTGSGGRVTGASELKYNYLQYAAEVGKAMLKEATDNSKPVPRYFHKPGVSESTSITSVDILLVGVPGGGYLEREIKLKDKEIRRLNLSGGRVTLKVKVYDMQYNPENISSGLRNTKDFELLPPSIRTASWRGGSQQVNTENPDHKPSSGSSSQEANAGVYLIRASLVLSGVRGGNVTFLDEAIIQSNRL
jgi:hypothetical protein